jgi:fructose-specific phosphotransferase system IIC component
MTSMKAKEQPAQRELKNEGEPGLEEGCGAEQILTDKPIIAAGEERTSESESNKRAGASGNERKKSSFVNGLVIGVGIGCVATFVVLWIAVFFSPKLPAGTTYETMLSIFVYPLVYLLSVGLVTLTAGIVREYFTL